MANRHEGSLELGLWCLLFDHWISGLSQYSPIDTATSKKHLSCANRLFLQAFRGNIVRYIRHDVHQLGAHPPILTDTLQGGHQIVCGQACRCLRWQHVFVLALLDRLRSVPLVLDKYLIKIGARRLNFKFVMSNYRAVEKLRSRFVSYRHSS